MAYKKILFLFLLISWIPQSVYGDFYNFRNRLIGERGAMMGGAYTALSEDISGSYYNSAGLAFMKRKALSMNGSVYSYQDYVQNVSTSGLQGEAKFKKFFIVPTTFGVSLPLWDGVTVSLALFEIDRVAIDTTLLINNSNINLKTNTDNYLFGPSVAVKLTKDFSLGLSAFYHLFQLATSEKVNVDLGGGARSNKDIQDNGSSGGFVFGLGFKKYFGPRWQVGFMYTSETFNTSGRITYTENTIETATPASSTIQGHVNGDVRLPHKVSIGVAYEERKKYTLALDLIYYFKLNYQSPRDYLSNASHPNRHLENEHFDLSLGGEVYLTDTIAFRLGFFTNTSSAPNDNIDKIQMFGGTIGVAHIRDGLSTGVGLKLMFGSSSDVTEIDGTRGHWKRMQIELIIGSSLLF